MITKISEEAISPRNLFAEAGQNAFYRVKPPQRRYKWEKKECREFLKDITKAYKRDAKSEYFLGTVFLQKEPGEENLYSVMDGQQRLTTLSILIAILRDQNIDKPYGNSTRVQRLHELLVRTDDGGKSEDRVLRIQEGDDEALNRWTREKSSSLSDPKGKEQQHLIYKAIEQLRVEIEKFLKESKDPGKELADFSTFVLDQVKLLALSVDDEAQAYQIFDTTNTRGLRLTPSEAFKARLAVAIGGNKELRAQFIKNWDSSATKFEAAGLGLNEMDGYLLALWSARFSYTTKSNLAKELQEQLDIDAVTTEEIVKDIGNYADSYLAVLRPKGATLNSADLKDIEKMKFTQAHGFLTMVLKHNPKHFRRAVCLALSLHVRNVAVGPRQANAFQSDWPFWSKLVRDGKSDLAFEEIKSKLDTNADFKRNFLQKGEWNDMNVVRHILRRLEMVMNPQNVTLLSDDAQVEHVLPKSVAKRLNDQKNLTTTQKTWVNDLGLEVPKTNPEKLASGKKIHRITHNIGNLALLHKKPNVQTGDKPFVDKRNGLKSQKDVHLTTWIGDKAKWREQEIIGRRKVLADLAIQTWNENDVIKLV